MIKTIFILGCLMVLLPYLLAKFSKGDNHGGEGGIAVVFIAMAVFLSGCILMGISTIFWIIQHVSITFS